MYILLILHVSKEMILLEEKNELYHFCTRYIRCNINNCPLGSGYPYYVNEADRNKECKLTKEELNDCKKRASECNSQ